MFSAWHPTAGSGKASVQTAYTYHVRDTNTIRLSRAAGYVTPQDKLERRTEQILAARCAKLQAVRGAIPPAHRHEFFERMHPSPGLDNDRPRADDAIVSH